MKSPNMYDRKTIFINGRFLTQKITGIQRYSREVLLAFDQEISKRSDLCAFRFVLLVPAGTTVPELANIEHETLTSFKGNFWEQFTLFWRTRKAILISFGSTGPILHRNQLITVHDAAVYRVPDAFNWRFRLWYKVMVNWIVRGSRSCFAVSEFAKTECIQFFGAREANICVCTEGWQHLERIAHTSDTDIQTLVGNMPFVLAVSSPTPNKNFRLVINAMQQMGKTSFDFVVAGSVDPSIFPKKQAFAGNARYLGYVTDEQLKGLYRNALCFVFPSRYEGFGIPPLEAMSLGCPVLASEIGAVKEVCGDSVTYFDPSNAKELAEKLLAMTSSPDSKGVWGAKGIARAQLFSWQKAANLVADHLVKNYQ